MLSQVLFSSITFMKSRGLHIIVKIHFIRGLRRFSQIFSVYRENALVLRKLMVQSIFMYGGDRGPDPVMRVYHYYSPLMPSSF